MASQTEENYLKALFNFSQGKGAVNISDLSASLEISTPTANSMVKKLHAKGLVHYEKYKPLTLTSKGLVAAALIVRKHRLTEMFLVEKMNFGWEEVHDIAEQVEHIKSSTFFSRMDELLGFPTVDPHGSPIPDKNGKIVWKTFDKLSDGKIGNRVKLSALLHSSVDFLSYLNSKKLSLGTTIEIINIEPFDLSMTVKYGNQTQILSYVVCEKLLVE